MTIKTTPTEKLKHNPKPNRKKHTGHDAYKADEWTKILKQPCP